ncbi:AAA family ATPase [Allokutzneria sp. NRRL B-24872]|uniref:AAA family ATPase n=1 Tax=Allokutzneria sp. NRRL B-24872 TaxID=1137961 RepID=UPI001FF06D72|nr:AAA family ATPase [Allokutzneria sp. NRRL B-24872]
MTDTPLFVLTGISASGKTTIGRLLADSFPRSAFVEGDLVREMVRSGRVDMSPEPSEDAMGQLLLRYRQAATLAMSFQDAGFATVAEDVIIGDVLKDYLDVLRGRPVHLVVLAPTPEAVHAREAARNKTGYDTWAVTALNKILHEQTPRLGLWLDTSEQTPEETVAEILARQAESLIA